MAIFFEGVCVMGAIVLSGKSVYLPDAKSEPAKFAAAIVDRLPGMIPAEVNKEQFLCALMAELNQMPKDATSSSVARYCMNSAILGLISGPALGHCFPVPFRRNRGKPNECVEIQMVIGYRGFIELGMSSGYLAGITPELIYKGEKYRRWNDIDGPRFEHDIDLSLRENAKSLADVEAAYALWRTREGYRDITLVTGGSIRKTAKAQGNVWDTNPFEMALKTPIRRASKTWKLTGRLAEAVRLDEQAEREEPQSSLAQDSSREPSLELKDLGVPMTPELTTLPAHMMGVEEALRPLVADRPAFDVEVRRLCNAQAQTPEQYDEIVYAAHCLLQDYKEEQSV